MKAEDAIVAMGMGLMGVLILVVWKLAEIEQALNVLAGLQ